VADSVTLEVPRGSVLLDVQEQHSTLCLWAIVDTEQAKAPLRLGIMGTGHPWRFDGWKYWRTVQMHGYVWHLFIAPDQPFLT
jgi:hypothetical protein